MASVTVLTPVYNGERHIRECIESVIRQTYRDWEYVIVDNCSRDGTPDIIDEYARQDGRIRVVTNTRFVDSTENHNIAFSHVGPRAEYCKVVQADDWIYPECIERFVEIGEANPKVVLASAYRIDNDVVGLRGLPLTKSVFSGRELARSLLLDGLSDVFGSPTSHFFRAASVRSRQPFWNPLSIHGDTEACYDVLRDGDFGFIHEVLTFTRRPGDTETAYSNYMRTFYPGFLWILKNHGRNFLSEEEFARCVRNHLRQYYKVMARDLLKLRRRWSYWRYHLTCLRKIGHPFSPFRLLGALPQVLKEYRRKDKIGNKV
jgi:glycosyltransferase involved in cell wall biosynthesis